MENSKDSDFSFMKTGFGDSSKNRIVSQEEIDQIGALLTTFTEKALENAAFYVSHSNRKVITKGDLELGFKYEVFEFLDRDDILQRSEYWKQVITEEDEEDSDSDTDTENTETENEEVFEFNNCDCDICKAMIESYNNWNDWEPQDPLETIIKNGVKIFES